MPSKRSGWTVKRWPGLGRTGRRACPGALVLDGCEAVYRAFAEQTFALCAEVSPVFETFLDEAFLDATGCERLFGSGPELARTIKDRIVGAHALAPSAGEVIHELAMAIRFGIGIGVGE
mgnify:CR=1 FL=1